MAPALTRPLLQSATSGIGENLAIYYAAPGVTLALTGRNAEALKKVTEACEAKVRDDTAFPLQFR
jgi:short-subunit dehydrogenase